MAKRVLLKRFGLQEVLLGSNAPYELSPRRPNRPAMIPNMPPAAPVSNVPNGPTQRSLSHDSFLNRPFNTSDRP